MTAAAFRTFLQRRSIVLPIALLLLTAATARPAAAQPTWIEATPDRPQVSLQWIKPVFEEGPPFADADVTGSFFTSRLLLSGQYPVTETLRLVAELPVSRFSIDSFTPRAVLLFRPGDDISVVDSVVDHSGTEVGNPYLGVHAQFGEDWATGGGIRLPLASTLETRGPLRSTIDELQKDVTAELALQSGALADLGRYGAFLPETLTARGYGSYTLRSGSGLSARFRAGLSLFSRTGTEELWESPILGEHRERSVLLDYGGQLWYEGNGFHVGLGLEGRSSLTATEEQILLKETSLEERSFWERSVYFLDVAVQAQFGRIRPSVVFRAPLSEKLSEQLRYAAGVGLAVEL